MSSPTSRPFSSSVGSGFPIDDPLFDVAPTLKKAAFPAVATSTHAEALQACFEALTMMNQTHTKPYLDPLATTLLDVISKMADACGYIMREINVHQIALRKEETTPFIVFDKETTLPALIYFNKATPYLYNPQTGENRSVSSSRLKDFSQIGCALYKKWPRETKTIPKMAKAAIRETSWDLKRFLVLQAFISLLLLAQPLLTGMIFDHVIKLRQYQLIDQVFMGMTAVMLGITIFKLVQNYAMMRFQAKSSQYLQSALWNRVLSFQSHFFRLLRVGDIHERIMTIDHLQKEMTTSSMNGITQGLFSILVLVFITFYLPMLGAVLFLITLVFAAISYSMTRHILVLYRSNTQTQARLLSFLFESIRSIIKIKTSNAQPRIFNRWLNLELSKVNLTLKAQYLLVYTHIIQFALPILVMIAFFMLMISGDTLGNASLSVGSFITVQMALGQYFGSIVGALGVVDKLLYLIPQVERSRIILRENPEQEAEIPIKALLKGKVTFQNVSFRYAPDNPLILDRVNFTIEPGEWVAITGPSGAGKSTLMRLLLGLEKPENGMILLDDIPLSQLDKASVRSQIATVLQHTQLLPGSIWDNLRASNPRITEQEALGLLACVSLYDDIMSMPMGIHTVIMGDGRAFSMGQRQRLVLARCLAKPLSMLLLDEATSALDNVSQEIILNTLSQIPVTRIMIAHRPSTIQRAHRILRMEEGKVSG